MWDTSLLVWGWWLEICEGFPSCFPCSADQIVMVCDFPLVISGRKAVMPSPRDSDGGLSALPLWSRASDSGFV
jgi:hypothetical protein